MRFSARKTPYPRRLRMRLVWLAMTIILPALAIILSDQTIERRRARDRAVQNALRLAGLAAEREGSVFDEVKHLLLTLSRVPALRSPEPAVCTAILRDVLGDHPGYANIVVMNADGAPFCSAIPVDLPAPGRGRTLLERVLQTRTLVVGEYQISRTTGQPDVLLAQPLVGRSGSIERVITVGINLERFDEIAAREHLLPGATLTLTDRNHTVLARYPALAGSVGKRQPLMETDHGTVREGEVIEATAADGVRRLYTIAGVDAGLETGLTVTMAMDRTAVFAEADEELRRHLILLALITALTIAVALVGGQVFVLRPFDALTKVTTQIATGDYHARAQLAAGVPGLKDLGDAVDQMAVALETRQRDGEEAARLLQASEQRYRLLFEQNPHSMWVYDLETLQFLEVNDATVCRYGYSRDEFLAMNLRDIRPPEEVDGLITNLAEADEEWDHSGQWRHLLKSGRVIDVEIISHALTFNGRPARLVLAQDITERRALEDQIRQGQRMEVVGQLAGGIAHDFNNMLTVILGSAEEIWAKLPPDDPRRRDVEEITEAARRSATLTQQLLAFSRKQIMTPRVIHIGDVVGEVTPMLRRLLGETVDLKSILGDRGNVKADAGQMEQVLVNLAVNARDAMPAGGHLTIETADIVVDAEQARWHAEMHAGQYVMVAVSDTGHGMDAATQGRVFEPFFTTKAKGQGTGLGLATVYGIVKQSGGHIWVYSEVGKGTTFKIYLSRIEEREEIENPAAVDPRTLRGKETILVVEDEDFVRNFVSKTLAEYGYSVHAMSNPRHAIEFAELHRDTLHLIFTDVVLPEMNGRIMATRLQQQHPESKVLYTSGYTDNAIVNHGLLDAGTAFLQKPFTANVLVRTVRDLLDTVPAVSIG